MGGAPQEVVQAAVSAVVGSRTDTEEVWRRRKSGRRRKKENKNKRVGALSLRLFISQNRVLSTCKKNRKTSYFFRIKVTVNVNTIFENAGKEFYTLD